jgi:hypothetical protein
VVFEVEAVDRVLRLQARQAEPALDGSGIASFQFKVGE